MHRPPTQGIPGAKPRLPGNGASASKEALAKLSEQYLRSRNAQLASKVEMAEMELARRRGEPISRYDARLRLGFLLTGLRQRLMSLPYSLPRLLVGKTEHEIGRIIDAEMRSALRDIATWPDKMARPGWSKEIDEDLRPAAEAAGNGDNENADAILMRERKNAERRRKYARAKE